MKKLLLLLTVFLAISCEKQEKEFSLTDTIWTCRYMDTDYTMVFGESTVMVSQYNYKHYKKYWDDACGSYTLSDNVVNFDLKLPVVVSQTHFLKGTISGNYMTVTTQDYLKGSPLGSESTLYFHLDN